MRGKKSLDLFVTMRIDERGNISADRGGKLSQREQMWGKNLGI